MDPDWDGALDVAGLIKATPDEATRQFTLVRGQAYDHAPPPADAIPPGTPIDAETYKALRERTSRRG